MVWKPGSKHSDPSSRVIARRNDWNSICVLHQGPRSMAASRGRIHDRSPIACRSTKKTLAERGPSIHDGWLPLGLQPLRRPAPQRVEMLRAEEAEMADLLYACIRWPDADDLRLGRGEARAEQLDRGARCPGVVDEAERAQGSLVIVEI